MKSKTMRHPASPLMEALPNGRFTEHHHRVIHAGEVETWEALHALSWGDLRLSRPFLEMRGISATARGRDWMSTFADRGAFDSRPPGYVMFLAAGKPWSPRGDMRSDLTLPDVVAFDEPGWLKLGMDWRMTPLPDGRTLVETSTVCEPTSTSARVRFTPYWAFIRPFSGLIRREMLAAIAHQVEGTDARASHLAPSDV